MNTLTVKIPESLETALAHASRKRRVTKSVLVRRALEAYLARPEPADAPSALALAGDLVGCFTGGPGDLSTNAAHLEGFGR